MAETPTQETESEETHPQLDPSVREGQNLSGDAVPEVRPQAFLRNEGPTESELTRKLREAGDPSVAAGEPMDKAAFDKAASKGQQKKAAESSKSEGIMVGNGVRSTKGPHEGRIFAVTRIVSHGNVADMIRTATGNPEQLYNTPKEVEVRAIGDERDGELLVLDVEDTGLVKLGEDWRGTRAGRRH